MTVPLEDYALIGDGETVALVSKHGSVDWLCLPRFDSPACCAALLGDEQHGFWRLAPEGEVLESRQSYRPDTMVLDTEFRCKAGTLVVTDFMPVRDGRPLLIRIARAIKGSVEVISRAAFRFDYGNMPPWIVPEGIGLAMHVGPDKLALYADVPLDVEDDVVVSRLMLAEGESRAFVLAYGRSNEIVGDGIDAEAALCDAEDEGRRWIARLEDDGLAYPQAVRRSLLTLKTLIHRPTGGLVAAPTTSLPEQPGGTMNWDYRYCWLRDAAFTLDAFVECGFVEEARDWRDWILRAVAGAPEKMQIMYRADGSRRLDEAELPWLPGYRFAKPVRVGNAAAGQLQLDVWGELMSALHIAERAGMERTTQGRHLEHAVVDHVARVWTHPDQGLWESRGEPRHYVYSKAMAWVVLDRFLNGRGAEELSTERRAELHALRDHMHATICAEGFDVGLNSFTSFYGGSEVDASLLLLPKIGFLPMSDARMAGTLRAIESQLVEGGFVRRHRMEALVPEGAFLACSFWLAECLLGVGRRADAMRTIEAVIGVVGGTGLLSEEYDTRSRRLAGNYPQALSHLALVQAVLALKRFDDGKRGNDADL
ncbi:glycoside hydrolase family 15 protein [Aureimonas phyllosphaerae]|uniref:GH15 family glucan-1,4-alpha-glucosidase n=1 Tax=Aureimonas phyllosphaerae TaxID=1166078 RepID=A0A7W6BSM2_9HYPH|nr:glycoside hydrolase family 15 protein [Aureimonas phyllosphaerae]MBB3937281.1 GH15 family glucan-1,4-alpha-glucosidase [Aureimonas phyllosphaerae]MBB3961288.1 GH15 family glucan-1,4-alpha-glucosidase [Aureimonas phyllosphaerae]SFF41496.1 Glucoamylase (glucan-1,4-alpha-glucosidase), GH15 family [Aureimonas phyllosphaerae]